MNEIQPKKINPLSPQELFEKFLRLSVANGSASQRTIFLYRQGISIFFGWCRDKDILPEQATYDHIEEYRKWLTDQWAKTTSSIRMSAIRAFFRALQRWGARPDNPAAGVKNPITKSQRTEGILEKAISPAGVREIMNWFLRGPKGIRAARDKAILYLMLFQGLRLQEICNLRMCDVDTMSWDRITVNGKGNKIRTLILSAHAREALMAWVNHRGERDMATALFYRLDEYSLKPLRRRKIQKLVTRILKATGNWRPGRGVHALRHTYATLAVIGGADREILADSLGHADTVTTDIYIRAAARFQENPADAVERAIQNQTPDFRQEQITAAADPAPNHPQLFDTVFPDPSYAQDIPK